MEKKSAKKEGVRFEVNVQRTAAERVLLNEEENSKVARDIGCSSQTVRTWVKKYRNELLGATPSANGVASKKTLRRKKHVVKKVAAAVASPSVPKTASQPSNDRPPIELVTKGGTTLRLPAETPSDTLYGVIRRLDEGK